jgi:MFS family permease
MYPQQCGFPDFAPWALSNKNNRVIWAGVIMLHAASYNWGGLMATRAFLGVAEASCTPAFAILVSLFYKRSEHASRQSFWFLGQAIGGACGAIITWAITFIEGALDTWQASQCLLLIPCFWV